MKKMNTKISESGLFAASQNIDAYVDEAAKMRSQLQGNTTFRSFCVIPDIVAVDIYLKHDIDIHSTEFEGDTVQHNKIKRIVKQSYPYLLTGGISNRFNMYTGGS